MLGDRERRLEKFRSITTEVFALTLGLGAFSLSLLPRTSLLEVAQAVGLFAVAFLYIVLIWLIQSRFFEKYALYDNTFVALNFVILFLVAISPFLMYGLALSSDLADPMSILYALDIMGIYAILGVLHHRFLQRNRAQLNALDTREVKMDRNMQFLIGLWFLVSVAIPMDFRFVFWVLLLPMPPLYRHLIGPRHVK